MDIPPLLIAAFPPSNQRLIEATRRQIDDDMLKEIADADYGCDFEKHLDVLRPIRDTGIVPALGWHGGEVLELIRWSNPEDPQHKPGSTGLRGHRMRAFACAVLLRSAIDFGSHSSDEATLALCLGSTRQLGRDVDEAAGSFLTWAFPRLFDSSALTLEPPHSERFLFALGLLAVVSRFPAERVPESVLADAIDSSFERTKRCDHPCSDWLRPDIRRRSSASHRDTGRRLPRN